LPDESLSITARFPESPYQPIALAEINTCGFTSATAFAIAVVQSLLCILDLKVNRTSIEC
jgi:hypothetical protein